MVGLASLSSGLVSAQTTTFNRLSVGEQNSLTQDGSAAVGQSNSVEASHSFGGGVGNRVGGEMSFAFGQNQTVLGAVSGAIGFANSVGLDSASAPTTATSLAMGRFNQVFGKYNIALGSNNSIGGNSILALGFGLTATHDNAVVVGRYNEDKAGLVFSVGSGSSDTSRMNAFEVDSKGNVFIPGNLVVGGQVTGVGSTTKNVTFANQVEQALGTYDSLAIGSGSSAVNQAFAVGINATASREGSLAFGEGSIASGLRAVALATGEARGEASLAVGRDAVAHGTGAIALGGSSEAFANYATAMGSGKAVGFSSFANGSNVYANTRAEVALGANNIRANVNLWGWVETDPIFSIGNSETRFVQSNAITILKNGKTTLTSKFWNRAQPTAAVTRADGSEGMALEVDGHARFNGKVIFSEPQGDISMGFYR